MKQKGFLIFTLTIIIFLGVAFANMQSSDVSNKETLSVHRPKTENIGSTPEIADRGKLLYENHCTDCHHKYVHKRNSNNINSINNIRLSVIRWSRILKLEWNKEEIETVTDYLNRRFYQFTH